MQFRAYFLWICLIKTGYSSKEIYGEILDAEEFDRVLVIPEVNGDLAKLVDSVLEVVHQLDTDGSLSMSSDEFYSLVVSETVLDRTRFTGPRTALVQLGNMANIRNPAFADCYTFFFSLEKVFGWKVYGLLGSAELASIQRARTSLSPQEEVIVSSIQERFRYAIHIRSVASVGFLGPSDKNMVLLSRSILSLPPSKFLRAILDDITRAELEKLWISSESEICQRALPKLTKSLSLSRVILQGAPYSRSLCGSRVVHAGRHSSILIDLSDEVSVTLLEDTEAEMLWPVLPEFPESRSEYKLSSFDHIIVLPDIHGDVMAFIQSLWLAYNEVSDDTIEWEAFRNHASMLGEFPYPSKRVAIVQLGDVVDRGPFTRQCYDLLLHIESMFGWTLVALYGNHELLNFHDQASAYVHKQDELRDSERVHAFSLNGKLWRNLSEKMVAGARFDDDSNSGILFVHGGINLAWMRSVDNLIPSVTKNSSPVHSMNVLVNYFLTQAADLSQILQHIYSPVWTRIFEESTETQLCSKILPPILREFQVGIIVVGHNPQSSKRVRVRCGGRILLADARMSAWMGNGVSNPTALVITTEGTAVRRIEELHSVGDVVVKENISTPPSQSHGRRKGTIINMGG